jgi:mannose PTS system EIIA component
MTVGILLVTHPGIGTSVLHSARRIVDGCPLPTRCLEVPVDANLERIRESVQKNIDRLDQGDGVLVLTDVFGATPNNVARDFTRIGKVAVLSGLNLPMLVRAYNYPDAPLKALCDTAEQGGIRGIQPCRAEDSQ